MAFLQFAKEIKGTATEDNHKGWIEFATFDFGASRMVWGGADNRTVGEAYFQDVTITRESDEATTALKTTLAKKDSLGIATLHLVGSDPAKPLQIVKLKDCLVVDVYQTVNGDALSETVRLAYTSFEVQSNFLDGAGKPVKGSPIGYDLIARKETSV